MAPHTHFDPRCQTEERREHQITHVCDVLGRCGVSQGVAGSCHPVSVMTEVTDRWPPGQGEDREVYGRFPFLRESRLSRPFMHSHSHSFICPSFVRSFVCSFGLRLGLEPLCVRAGRPTEWPLSSGSKMSIFSLALFPL